MFISIAEATVTYSKVFVTDSLADIDVECKVPDADSADFKVEWTNPSNSHFYAFVFHNQIRS